MSTGPAERPVRVCTLWCPDWSVVAAGAPPDEPVAVVHANRVRAASLAARAEGVAVGQRRRDAQARCPELVVVEHDPGRDARMFEPVLQALEAITPRVEVHVPGRCAFPTRGPSRYVGGDEALARIVAERVGEALDVRVRVAGFPGVGVADGAFTSWTAAHRAAGGTAQGAAGDGTATVVVEAGGSGAFLAPLPVGTLDLDPVLAEAGVVALFTRLGLRRLGDVAALAPADLLARFGEPGVLAARLAAGLDHRPPSTRQPRPDLAVCAEPDPPAERVEHLVFAARVLGEQLHGALAARGLACTRVVVEAETAHGERHERCWRHEGTLSAAALAERVRWQLEGWLSSPDGPTAGVTLLRLVPDEVVADRGRQLGFWGGQTRADEEARRGLARVAALLGPEAVRLPERRGGRGPGDQVALVPAESVDLAARLEQVAAGGPPARARLPWPGRLPPPSPAVVHPEPPVAEVVDAGGRPVAVSGRGELSAPPARCAVTGRRPEAVVGWAGPWCYDERWWDAAAHRRRARMQVVLAGGEAHLLALEGGTWRVEATYD